MATMLQEMYGATGKVGNKTYYQSDGKTIVRVVVTPKNPKTSAQTVQRVLVKAVGLTYAKMKEICNHSFEGYESGARCANRFRSVNLKDLRERASTLQNSGQSLNTFYQFMPLQSNRWQPFAAIISDIGTHLCLIGYSQPDHSSAASFFARVAALAASSE